MAGQSQTLTSRARRSLILTRAILLTLLALLSLSEGAPAAPGNIHSAVFAWSDSHPDRTIPVIVQSSSDTDALASFILSSGGDIERRFQSVPALEATIPRVALAELASRPGVGWVSLDAPVTLADYIDVSGLSSAYPFAVNAPAVWNAPTPRTGAGVGIAIIDSGISSANNPDFADNSNVSRVVAEVAVKGGSSSAADGYGHGTHVAGIAAGDGDMLHGKYVGIAPRANLVNIKIADDAGAATIADAIAGIEWAVANKDAYNIRVLNLSLHSSVAQSYKTDPLDAAVEVAWFSGIVVVTSAGNRGGVSDAVSYAPANDPFVIVVGATDDAGTPSLVDDTVASFSSRGVTQDGFAKPDIVAPGRKIISDVNLTSILAQQFPDRIVDQSYMRLSGTSMSAPVVAGITALMLEQTPTLSPGNVKDILLKTAQPLPTDPSAVSARADTAVFFGGIPGNTDITLSPGRNTRMGFAARIGAIAYVLGDADPQTKANSVGIGFERLGPPGTNLDNVNWEAIKWNAIKWNAIKWDAINWDAIKWNTINWDAIKWNAVKWDAIKWDAIKWNAIKWNAIKWDAIKWSAVEWEAVITSDATLTGANFDSSTFDSTGFDSYSSE